MKRLSVLIGCLLVLSACAVPHQRGDLSVEKNAARASEVKSVFDRYRSVRNTAISLLDPKPLSTVESGAVLAIDSGSFEVSQRLAQKLKKRTSAVDVADLLTPRFTTYPLWFLAVVRDRDLGVNRVQIFERESAVDPWLLMASPETVAATALPELRRSDGDVVVRVKANDSSGMSMSAQQAAETYAKVLADGSLADADKVAADSFISQMRSAAATNSDLKDVAFSQTWDAEKVRYVLRTSDGGALAFVTLRRLDTYKVKDGLTVSWPKGTPQQAFLSTGISSSGKLRYFHQVLLHIPGGNGKPRALGQYGGVIGADGS